MLLLRLKHGSDYGGARNILVFDLGGGTFDCVLLKRTAFDMDKVTVENIDGDVNLGGQDWDQRLMKMALEVYRGAC